MRPIQSSYAFCNRVCSHVRFTPDHPAIRAELGGHIEDRREALMEQGLSRDEAERRAVAAMGDPEELGRRLDREHSWLLGWAQIWFHRLFLAAAVLLSLLLLDDVFFNVPKLFPHNGDGYVFSQGPSYENGETYDQKLSREAILDIRPNVSLRTDDYTFTVTRAVLRDFDDHRLLQCLLKVTHSDPRNSGPMFLDHLSAVDDLGNWYPGWALKPPGHPIDGGAASGNLKSSYYFTSYYEMSVSGLDPAATEVTLVYDRAGHRIHLTIPLTGEEGTL